MTQAASMADFDSGFDHFATGFPLSGGHRHVDCDACHMRGMFVGTPVRCDGCLNNVRAAGYPGAHIPSNGLCDDCHTTAAQCERCHLSTDDWRRIRFDHSGAGGSCNNCHNGNDATGKPSGHFVTTAQCDGCHTTSGWTPTLN